MLVVVVVFVVVTLVSLLPDKQITYFFEVRWRDSARVTSTLASKLHTWILRVLDPANEMCGG